MFAVSRAGRYAGKVLAIKGIAPLVKEGIFTLILICLTGCATTGLPPGESQGVYHRVKRGETLYRISRAYGVGINLIMRTNDISQPTKLKAGQRLFIPAIGKPAKIEPSKSNRWSYIVIHHSGTKVGNARRFERMHRRRGFRQGLGYHFVICNGTSGRGDGQIEVGERWRKQMDGAHCHSMHMNRIGIGLCLVGDFNRQHVSEKQFASLVKLIKELRRSYAIPADHIIGHRDVKATDCPGKNFPWKRLMAALRQGKP